MKSGVWAENIKMQTIIHYTDKESKTFYLWMPYLDSSWSHTFLKLQTVGVNQSFVRKPTKEEGDRID